VTQWWCWRRTSGPGAFQLTDRVGVVRPAIAPRLARSCWRRSLEQLEQFLQRAELKAYTPRSITNPNRLRREVAEVRRTGIAFDDGEFDPGNARAALPVRDFSGKVTGSIGISGPVWRLSIEALQKRARVVRAAADRLSAEFGYTRESEEQAKAAI
jgi:DNA-binding IclR family transcriptional regulator